MGVQFVMLHCRKLYNMFLVRSTSFQKYLLSEGEAQEKRFPSLQFVFTFCNLVK